MQVHLPIVNPMDLRWKVTRKLVSENDQEISQTTDNPLATRGRVAQPLRDTRKIN